MAYTQVLTEIPSKITAGTSVSWLSVLGDYPASEGWTLTYTLISTSAQISFASSADGDSHLIEIPYTTTQAWGAGEYAWQGHVSNGTERYQVDSGLVEIVVDYATETTGADTRTWLDKAIDALEAAIEGRANKTQLVQSLPNGLQIQHMKLSEQIDALNELKRMKAAASGKWRRTISSRFRN